MTVQKKPSLPVKDYFLLRELLLVAGFRPIPQFQKIRDIIQRELKSPRKITGSEEGWERIANGYRVIVWTTFLLKEGKFRDSGEDIFWVIIVKDEQMVYCSKPIPRVPGSVVTLARQAWVTQYKIRHIPHCLHCGRQMEIFRKRGTRSYMFCCMNSEAHPDGKWEFTNWDYELPPKAQAFVDSRRFATAKYKERNEKMGKTPTPKAVTRNRWIRTKKS